MAKSEQGYGFFEWVNRHVRVVTVVVVILGIGLAAIAQSVAAEGEPSFDPGGEIYDTQDRADAVFASSSPIQGAAYLVENSDPDCSAGDVVPNPERCDILTRDALLEFKENSDAFRADPESQQYYVTTFDARLGLEIDGVVSMADAVDASLPNGLAGATDAEVKAVIADLLADGAPTQPLVGTLSQLTARSVVTDEGTSFVIFRSPAMIAELRYDADAFPQDAVVEGFGDDTNLDTERWLRNEVQPLLRGEEREITAIGLAVDEGLVSERQNNEAGPFIFFAVAFIVLFVGALLRSYWAAMIVGAGLAVVMMFYNGINAVIQLKVESPLLILIVPIALISFGVDFFIHGSGRVREEQVDGYTRERAYPLGMTAIFAALLLAALSSAGAFLSNAASGIQAITEFGIAAGLGIFGCYVILGLLCPRVLMGVEEGLGKRPAKNAFRLVMEKVGFTIAAFVAGIIVTMMIVFPQIGIAGFVLFVALLIGVPFWLTRRRNRVAAEKGKFVHDHIKGAGHGFRAAGDVVHFLARWRVITLPVTAVLAVFALWGALQVESAFELEDFFSPETDFIKSVDRFNVHYSTQSGGDGYIYVEGDLTDPQTIRAMEVALVEVDESGVELGRNLDGEMEVFDSAIDVVRISTLSGPMRDAAAVRGVEITDTDGDGIADDASQIAAIYAVAGAEGVVDDDANLVYRPDQVETFLNTAVDGSAAVQATRLQVVVPTITDDEIILGVRGALDAAAVNLESNTEDEVTVISVSGGSITQQAGLAAFTDAMLVALPIAIVITVILALIFMRSFRYALVSMVPILLVVAWVYGYMFLRDHAINPITATIAAIAVGVGIDYATHFTMRFRQEFEHEPSRFPAIRRAGEGTGGALAISALTSMIGFAVLANAPAPLFATFGELMAVMIFFALVVSLLVLPSLLVLVTPSRRGEERAEMEASITKGEFDYEPHARDTALRRGGEQEDPEPAPA